MAQLFNGLKNGPTPDSSLLSSHPQLSYVIEVTPNVAGVAGLFSWLIASFGIRLVKASCKPGGFKFTCQPPAVNFQAGALDDLN